MDGLKQECIITGYPNVISYKCINKIIEQMERFICKIKIGNKQGTGFFCKIPFPDKDKNLNVIITNNHIINEESFKNINENKEKLLIMIKEENMEKIIDLNDRLKYTNKEYDITIIEIKEKDNINNYLKFDEIILNDIIKDNNKNIEYIDKTIYIIQYPEGELSVSFGTLNNIEEEKKFIFRHTCNTKEGSSGAPILSINNKIIGIHTNGLKGYNIGKFMNYPLKEFIQQYKSNTILNKDINIEKNEILLNNFNKKYNLNIKDTNIEILNLDNQKIRNEGLKDLYKIENNNIFDKKIKINSNIYYPQNSYKNNDISGIKNNIYEKKVNKIINNNYYNLYNSIKYEDLIILEDNIINLNIIYSNYNNEYKTMF